MQYSLLLTLGLAISRSASAPTPQDAAPPESSDTTMPSNGSPAPYDWDADAVHDFRIHESCNASEQVQLRKGLQDAVALAAHARIHILRHGNSSVHYQKYFGNGAPGQIMGWYDKVIEGDRGNSLFRCDNPDGNCDIPTYGGHWRGENATHETVICDLSFETRKPIEQLCAMGYTVAGSETNTYFGSDLLHRLYHMPAFGDEFVGHYAETYAEALELGATNGSFAVRDSDILQYFALDVYAYDIIVPGVGCPGEATAAIETEMASASESAAVAPTTSDAAALATSVPAAPATSEPPTPTMAEAVQAAQAPASTVVDVPPGCHTHAGGVVHCE